MIFFKEYKRHLLSLLFFLFIGVLVFAYDLRNPDFARVDFDLSKLNKTMIAAFLSDMDFNCEKYENKTIRIKGFFYIFDETSCNVDDVIFGCVVPDEAGCCLKGLGFKLKSKDDIKNKKIKPYDEIIVTGIFKTYDEKGEIFKGLVQACLDCN